jgi:hypothetical protein
MQFTVLDHAMKTKVNFNYSHPECRPGEILLMNIVMSDCPGIDDQKFIDIGYKTARVGETAYDRGGVIIQSAIRPVFVKKREYHWKQIQFWSCSIFVTLFFTFAIYRIIELLANN